MEYDLVHALFGRFAVLIPLLAIFFELAGLLSGKSLVSKIAGFLVLLGVFTVLVAFITGVLQYKYLLHNYADVSPFKLHTILGTFVAGAFLIIGLIRIFLFFKPIEKLIVFYMIFYVITVLINLVSNEVVVHNIYQ